jgi:SAM-dependent methyltransferase
VVRCRGCGLVFVSPREDLRAIIDEGRPLAELERLRHSRDPRDLAGCWELDLLAAETPALRQARRVNHQAALRWIAAHRPPPGRLLDFGCGWGFFLEDARAAGWQVQGLEPLPGHGVHARGALGLDVVTDTLRPDSFPPASFDVVTAFQVFEHLPDPGAELAKLHALLRPGGLVVIEVPNIATPLLRLLGGRHRHFVEDHLWFFSPRSLGRLLERQGFQPLATHYPTRRLPLERLLDAWAARYLPPSALRGLRGLAGRAGLLELRLPVNLRDIVLLIGRKA